MKKETTTDGNGRAHQGPSEVADRELVESQALEEAGFVRDLDERDESTPSVEERRHRAKTASFLAYTFVGILVVTLVLHYVATLMLGYYGQLETVEALSQLFDKAFPAITGFVGAAVTYYFTRERP